MFPYEPLISVECQKNVIKRYVAKGGKRLIGSVKELWNTGDYDITITGSIFGLEDFHNPSSEHCFPRKDMEILRDFLTKSPKIKVYNELLMILDIHEICIESISFPFVKGENVLAYEIKAISNFPYDLIVKSQKEVN